jgi:predicted amidohydrolase
VRISVVQMCPGQDKAANIAQAAKLIEAAIQADGPELVGLPEVWSCLGGSTETKFAQAETLPAQGSEQSPGAAYRFLRDTAERHAIHLHGGSIIERDGDRLYNTTLVFGPDGRELARYRKIHLFDIVTPDGTGYRESATFGAGNQLVTYRAGAVTVGCSICYDLRFGELFIALRQAGAELIFLPSAFTLQTGKDHWLALLRARAIETQCWIAAPATIGRHEDATGQPRTTWGHSMICDPWGDVVAQASDGIGWATARLDPAITERVRRDMPVLAHRALRSPLLAQSAPLAQTDHPAIIRQ